MVRILDRIKPFLSTGDFEPNKTVVLQSSHTHKYFVFESLEEYESYFADASIERNFHEVFTGNETQRFRLDIDYDNTDNIDNTDTTRDDFVRIYLPIILGAVKAVLGELCGVTTRKETKYIKYVLYDSSSPKKISLHVIFDFCFTTSTSTKAFYHALMDKLAVDNSENPEILELLRKVLDSMVYSPVQAFRLPGHHKSSSPVRVKRFLASNLSKKDLKLEKGMVKVYDCANQRVYPVIPDFTYEPRDNRDKYGITTDTNTSDFDIGTNTGDFVTNIVDDATLDRIEMVAREFSESFVLRNYDAEKGILNFNRIKPSYCALCKRVHDKDNTLFVTDISAPHSDSNQNVSYTIHCRHADENKRIRVNMATKEICELKTFSMNSCIRDVDEYTTLIKPIEDFYNGEDNKTVYRNEKGMNEYVIPEDAKFFFVKAGMKMGKTKMLKRFLEEKITKEQTVLFVSFRVLFSIELQNKLVSFTNYLNIPDKEISLQRYKHLIIQLESLHRLSLEGLNVDVLILDEVESVLQQFSSPYIRYSLRYVWEVFKMLVLGAKKVICMDANMSARPYETFKSIMTTGMTTGIIDDDRSDSVNKSTDINTTDINTTESFHKSTYLHHNTNSTMKNDTFRFIQNETDFYQELKTQVFDNNKRVVLPINSLKKAKLIHGLLTQECQSRGVHKNIMLYSSETDDYIKKKDLLSVNTKWTQYDVVLYTPCITAGVSFEQEHFDICFSYFITTSCDIYTALQMTYRVRNIKDGLYNVFIENFSKTEKTEKTEIECDDDADDSSATAVSATAVSATAVSATAVSATAVSATSRPKTAKEYRAKIMDELQRKFKNFVTECCALQFKFEWNEKRNEIIKKVDTRDEFFTLWLENKYFETVSRENFVPEFVHLLKSNKCTVQLFKTDALALANRESLKQEFMRIKELIVYEENEKLLLARPINEQEYQDMQNRILLSEEQKVCKKKYFIKKCFNVHMYSEGDMYGNVYDTNDAHSIIKKALVDESDKALLLKFLGMFNDDKLIEASYHINRVFHFTKAIDDKYNHQVEQLLLFSDCVETVSVLLLQEFHKYKLLLQTLRCLGFVVVRVSMNASDNLVLRVPEKDFERKLEEHADKVCEAIALKYESVVSSSSSSHKLQKSPKMKLQYLNKVLTTFWGMKIQKQENEYSLRFSTTFKEYSYPVEIDYGLLG
jgi:hypothetical protein